MNRSHPAKAFSLLELLAVVAMLGLIAAIVLPRISGPSDESKRQACFVNKGDIEIQAEIWMHNTGNWPAANLTDIGVDTNYFPEGVPTCPVDGTAYSIDPNTGRVIGHNH